MRSCDERCAGDEALRREVEALLAAHADVGRLHRNADRDARRAAVRATRRPTAWSASTIGHWEILKRIGSGGMGAVYLARRADRQYEQQVALKLIKRGMDTEAMLRRFRNERQILAGFDHPNIARLLDGDTTEDGLPYFVMEYVEGMPIDEYCDAHALAVTERLQPVSPGLRGGLVRASACGHPPRPQALEHPGQRRRRAEAARLRHRPAAATRRRGRVGRHTARAARADAGVRKPGAAARRAGHDRERRLFARRRAVPAADRPAAVPRRRQSRPRTWRARSARRSRSGRAPSPARRAGGACAATSTTSS